MLRQQAFLSALISKVKGQGMNPTTLLPLANAATKSLTVDPGLGSAAKLMSFGLSLKGIDLKNIQFITAPWKYAGSRIDLVHPDVDNLFAELRADRTLDGVNASGKSRRRSPTPGADGRRHRHRGLRLQRHHQADGLAGKAAHNLKADDFTVMNTTNAKTRDHATTRIEYGAGADGRRPRRVAKLFPGAQLVPLDTTGVNVVLGQDFAKSAAASASAAPTPLPTKLTEQARSADADPCSKLSYG